MPRQRFHIFGSLYGFKSPFIELLKRLNYDLSDSELPVPPPGRTPVSLGSIIGPGEESLALLRIWMEWNRRGVAVVIPGEAEEKLFHFATGRLHRPEQELAGLWTELRKMEEKELARFLEEFERFFVALPPFQILDGEVIVVHRALTPECLKKPLTLRTREICIHGLSRGDDDKETNQNGKLAHQLRWVWEWNGVERVVSAGAPNRLSRWVNRCISLDGGPPWGGKIVCLLYPELELVWIPTPRIASDLELADFPQ